MDATNDVFAHPIVQELRRQRDSLADANAILTAQMRAVMTDREAMSKELEALRPPGSDQPAGSADAAAA